MPTPLLATKLYIPPARPKLVSRPRLVERLNAGLQRKLTLVSAPAGFGKTTLLSAWIDGRGGFAWLSLDENDNDLLRFLTYVVAALQQVDEALGVNVQVALQAPQPPAVDNLLTMLLNDVAANPHPFALVLDDYHVITSQAIHDALGFLLDHLPPAMRLVIAGRTDPPLSISRLRVQGQASEVRSAELRFTAQETSVFLNDLMGLDLSSQDIAALETRTEGWIASLQLAALSLQERRDKREFIAAFSGSHRYVMDYLVDEVMTRQPQDIQSFLRQTSTLDRFCAPLCDAILSNPLPLRSGDHSLQSPFASSQQILRRLEKDNLFLVPLDDERRWYRYHHLFASFLRQRLREKQPEHIPELHRRASQWYEAQGLADQAIQHALTAKDLERVAHLADQSSMSLIVRNESKKLLDWIKLLPPALLQDYPRLCIGHAWALLLAMQLDAVESILQIAEANRAKAPQFPIAGYATAVRAFIANQMWDLSGSVALCQQALEQMAHAPPQQDTLVHRGIAVLWLAVNYRNMGDLGRARQMLPQAVSLNQQADSIYPALAAMEQSGELTVSQGRLRQAVDIYRRGLQMAQEWAAQHERGRVSFPAAAGLYLRLGAVLYQLDDLAGAAPHIQRAAKLNELGGTWERMPGYTLLGYLKQAQGDYKAAYDLLKKARAIRDELSARQLNVMAEPGLEQLHIMLGRARPKMAHLLDDVARRIESRGLRADDEVDFSRPADYVREFEYSDLARSLIALGRAAEALPLLERLLQAAQSMGRQDDALRFLALRALAFQALQDTPSALDVLSQALALAEPAGYVRLFVDQGQAMADLLARALSQNIAPAYAGKLLNAFPQDIRQAIEPDAAKPAIDPLSERELEVLRLMAAGLPHKKVAEQLVISLNTVRHHARNIYGKLDVNSRAQAIARAQELSLL